MSFIFVFVSYELYPIKFFPNKYTSLYPDHRRFYSTDVRTFVLSPVSYNQKEFSSSFIENKLSLSVGFRLKVPFLVPSFMGQSVGREETSDDDPGFSWITTPVFNSIITYSFPISYHFLLRPSLSSSSVEYVG